MRFNRFRVQQLKPLAGVVCFLLLAVTNIDPAGAAPHGLQFLLLYVGIALLIVGFGATTDFRWRKFSRREGLTVAGVLGLALVLRLWQLGSSIRAPVDEVLPMTEILALWTNPNLPMISPFQFVSSLTTLFASWQAGSVAIFGHNLLALRIPSAIVGTLTVGATYFLGRVLFDRRTALIGALLLATFPPHLQFSRIGLHNIADPLFGTLAFTCIAMGFKSNQRLAWVLGGVALGLSQYFYDGGRLLYPALIALWVMFTLLTHRKAVRSWARGLLIYGATAVVIAAPIYLTLATANNGPSTRLNTLALTREDWFRLLTAPPGSASFDWLTRHTVDPFLLFINRPDPTAYYGGNTALILVFLIPAFLAGLVWSIRSQGGRGLLLWFLMTWAGNLLLVDSALAARYVTVFSAVALLMAIGINQIASYLPVRYRHKVVIIYVVFCLIAQAVYYFGPHVEQVNQLLVPGRDGYDALFRAANLPPGTSVVLVDPPESFTESYAQTFLHFLADNKSIHLIEAPASFDFSALPGAATYAFFIPSDDTTALNRLAQHFDLQVPIDSPYPLPKDKAYTLYLSTHKSQSESP